MISRRTARAIAEVYISAFYKTRATGHGYSRSTKRVPDPEALYDFLFDREYQAWFCNLAKRKKYTLRGLKEFFMRIHTGESLHDVTKGWSWDQRRASGQQLLENLAEDILNYWHGSELSDWRKQKFEQKVKRLSRSLELDGYTFTGEKLLVPEEDVLDTQEETGILIHMYSSLELANQDTATHHLDLSEEHYMGERWDDSIGNSRKFLECVLQEVAAAHSLRFAGTPLPDKVYNWPGQVRSYLEEMGLLEKKEVSAIKEVYGLLSETGGHPYMARHDQARLLRHLALTFAQFVLIRFQAQENARGGRRSQ